jgi:hypothetical protein
MSAGGQEGLKMAERKHPISPNQLVLWSRHELTELFVLSLSRRPRSGRAQAVRSRGPARIIEKCWKMLMQVIRPFSAIFARS